VAFALSFAFAFRHFAPLLSLQLDRFEWWIRYAQKEQLEPYAERPKIDAKQLDKLEQIFAANPRFDDAFWQSSRRVANWRGPSMATAVMNRSHTWNGEEGSVFVPLLALLPRTSVLNTLKRSDKSATASERHWAAEFRARLNSPETKAAVAKFSRNMP
jgi:hypothetical protein